MTLRPSFLAKMAELLGRWNHANEVFQAIDTTAFVIERSALGASGVETVLDVLLVVFDSNVVVLTEAMLFTGLGVEAVVGQRYHFRPANPAPNS